MTNAQQWLEEWYPRGGVCQADDDFGKNKGKKRNEIRILSISQNNLWGDLDFSDFTNLEELYCWENKLTSLNLSENKKLRILSCSNNKLRQLLLPAGDSLEDLSCNVNELTELDLTNYSNLRGLKCWRNKIDKIRLPIVNQLESILVNDNLLTSFKFSLCNSNTLKELCISNNFIEWTDISVFSNLTKLVNLDISSLGGLAANSNRFAGSLKSLENLTNLESLSINNVHINEGLEYLPESLEKFYCSANISWSGHYAYRKVKEIEDQLKEQVLQSEVYDAENWSIYWLRLPQVQNRNITNWKKWRNGVPGFKELNKRDIQAWVQEKFTVQQAAEWSEKEIKSGSHAYFLQKIKSLIPQQYSELNQEEKNQLMKEYYEWNKAFFWCIQCWKRSSRKNAYFIKPEEVFCSQACQQLWSGQAQRWLDNWYPKDGKCLREEDSFNFGKTREEVDFLDLSKQSLSDSLDFSDFSNLQWLDCSDNQLTSLNVSNCLNLLTLNCSDNKLNSLDLTQNTNLESLTVNNCPSNPSWLSHLVNLRRLDLSLNSKNFNGLKGIDLRDNNFVGSLEFVKYMNKLENLNILGTGFTSGLEFLPNSLKFFICSAGKIQDQLAFYGFSLDVWRSFHPELMIKIGKESIAIDYSQLTVEKIISTPNLLKSQFEITSSDFSVGCSVNLNYSDFLIRYPALFSWEENEQSNFVKSLPRRLYQISTNQVIDSELLPTNINYAIMSYVWGDLADKINLTTWDYTQQDKDGIIIGKQIGVNKEFGATGTTKESVIALRKAIATLNFINKGISEASKIDYLWMDQICINQFDNIEQGQEVPKMKQYYDNASITLISIDSEIGKNISNDNKVELTKSIIAEVTKSPWFTRAWTFQEGLLSKQTIFMFDDFLVDGRLLATFWGGWQSNGKLKNNIFATPLGWSYGAQGNHSINLSLGEALLAVKHRQQGVPVDGVYAVLGLLSYGNKVKVNYKQWGQKYSQSDLEEALKEAVKCAYQHDPKQIFTYLGSRNADRWYLPMIELNGSTNVEEFLATDNSEWAEDMLSKVGQITTQGIQILKGHIIKIDYDRTAVEINSGTGEKGFWSDTIQIIVSESNKSPIIKKSKSINNSESPQELFIDLINKKIITKKNTPIAYRQTLFSERILKQTIDSLENQLSKLTTLVKDEFKKKNFIFNLINKEKLELFEVFLNTGYVDPVLASAAREKKIDLASITDVKESIKRMKKKLADLEIHQLEESIESLELKLSSI